MFPERFMSEERASSSPRPARRPLLDGPPPVDEQPVDGPAVLMATCTPNSAPFWHDDVQRCEHGFQINVLDAELHIVVTIDLPEWESFRPASAGHRLIEHGWMIAPHTRDEQHPETVNGWRAIGSGWVTQVISTEVVTG